MWQVQSIYCKMWLLQYWIPNFTKGLNRSNDRYFFSNTVFKKMHLHSVNLKLIIKFPTLTLEKVAIKQSGSTKHWSIHYNEKSNEIWQLVQGVLLNCSPSWTSQIFIIFLSFDRSITTSLDSMKMLQL